jgi:hypothetical protein
MLQCVLRIARLEEELSRLGLSGCVALGNFGAQDQHFRQCPAALLMVQEKIN